MTRSKLGALSPAAVWVRVITATGGQLQSMRGLAL